MPPPTAGPEPEGLPPLPAPLASSPDRPHKHRMTPPRSRLKRTVFATIAILVGVIAAGVFWLCRPLSTDDLVSHARPAASYEEAAERIRTIEENQASLPLHEGGRSVVLSHGEATERVFVLLHGFTNSPRQFRDLGERLFATGANVVIPRLPHHGLADRLTDAHGELQATDLILYAETGIDIARGLGKRITVVGLSVSGVSAAWVAVARGDVDEVFLLAPFFGPAVVPDVLTPSLAAALVRLPNKFMWWNPKLRENLPGPPTNYPRFATRPLGEVMRLGLAAEKDRPVRVRRLSVVLTAGDPAVNNRRTLRIVREWEENSPGVEFFVYTFPREARVPHDFIDPQQDGAQIDRVYPLLLGWLTRPPA